MEKINKRLFIAELLISLSLILSTGFPLILWRRIVQPSLVRSWIWGLSFLSLAIMWRGFFRFQKNRPLLAVGLTSIFMALARRFILPPTHLVTYDLLLLSLGFILLFQSSGLRELFLFSFLAIMPLALSDLYGFMAPSLTRFILVCVGLLVAFILQIWPARPQDFNFKKNIMNLDHLLALFLTILLGTFTFLLIHIQQGSPKNRRVAFDLGHGSTQSPQLEYNTNLETSVVHGHGRLVDFLRRNNYEIENVHEISPAVLAKISILVLIMPSYPYQDLEIKAIREFVSQGGGLLVIGDHTNLSQVLSSVNPVIEQFGLRLRFDTLWLQENDRLNLVYSRHPILFDLDQVNFSVGASLEVNEPAKPLLCSRHAVFSDLGDPENESHSYLGNAQLDPQERINDLCLMAECRYGLGRVIVLGDSAYFQNASFYQNIPFAHRLFAWLNQQNMVQDAGLGVGDSWFGVWDSKLGVQSAGFKVQNSVSKIHDLQPTTGISWLKRWSQLKIIILGLATLLILIFGWLVYRRSISPFLGQITVFSIFVALWLSGFLYLQQNKNLPQIAKTILLDMAHQNEYGLYWLNRENIDIGLDGLISQIIRRGLYPVVKTRGTLTPKELSQHQACWIICPNAPLAQEEIEALADFVERGGGLLLVEGARKWAVSQSLWERFGLVKERYPLSVNKPILSPLGLPIRLPYGRFMAETIEHPLTSGLPRLHLVNPCLVRGGQSLALLDGEPVMVVKEFGQGKIIAIGDDRIFANYLTEYEGKVIDPSKLKFIWNIIDYLENDKMK